VYELILAFDELVKANDRFSLHIGGDPHPRFRDYYQAILRLIELRGLKDKITLYGNISKPEDWYSQIDIFISNSYNEGLQVSPLEAIASGCFALSHNWSGADEFFPAENLYFTDQELIEKILHFSQSNPAVQQAMKKQLLTILRERFDIDQTKVQIRKVVEEVALLTQQKSLTR
jgi:glycosyltransferase involved in cell wall biosynthesis